jgi:hypothetical protein
MSYKNLWENVLHSTSTRTAQVEKDAYFISEGLSATENIRLMRLKDQQEKIAESTRQMTEELAKLYGALSKYNLSKEEQDALKSKLDLENSDFVREVYGKEHEDITFTMNNVVDTSFMQFGTEDLMDETENEDSKSTNLDSASKPTLKVKSEQKVSKRLFDMQLFKYMKNLLATIFYNNQQSQEITKSMISEKFTLLEESQRKYYLEPRLTNVGSSTNFDLNFDAVSSNIFYKKAEAVSALHEDAK